MQYTGIWTGLVAFAAIGALYPLVIRCEYWFSERAWPVFLIAGSVLLAFSLVVESVLASSCLGVLGFVCLWCIGELKEQAERVRRGWFPSNPQRITQEDSIRGQER